MKTRIVNKNALRMEGTDFIDHGREDLFPIVVGKIGLTDISNIAVTSGSALLMVDIYLFYKDFGHESKSIPRLNNINDDNVRKCHPSGTKVLARKTQTYRRHCSKFFKRLYYNYIQRGGNNNR
jgi:hypothetical protein